VEDSHSGIGSAKAAGMCVIAIPNPSFPPDDEALAAADIVLDSIDEPTVATVLRCSGATRGTGSVWYAGGQTPPMARTTHSEEPNAAPEAAGVAFVRVRSRQRSMS